MNFATDNQPSMSFKVEVKLSRVNTLLLASSQAPPTLYRIRNKKGESLEDFDHVLDMVGCGLQSFDHTLLLWLSIEQC